jgi:hypothetical protein
MQTILQGQAGISIRIGNIMDYTTEKCPNGIQGCQTIEDLQRYFDNLECLQRYFDQEPHEHCKLISCQWLNGTWVLVWELPE